MALLPGMGKNSLCARIGWFTPLFARASEGIVGRRGYTPDEDHVARIRGWLSGNLSHVFADLQGGRASGSGAKGSARRARRMDQARLLLRVVPIVLVGNGDGFVFR